MRIKNKLFGFTIAEAIVCFCIIGLIFIATITNIGRNDHYDKLYWQAYNTLYQASKAASTKFESNSTLNYKSWWVANNHQGERNQIDGTLNLKRKYPGFLRGQDTINRSGVDFCRYLTEFINTLDDEKQCQSVDISPNFKITETRGKVGVNFFEGFSNIEKGEDGTYDISKDKLEPSFTAVNGQRFYISQLLTANYEPKSEKFAVKERESFRFIVVDLNGDAEPNSQFIKSKKNPDLVLFAVDSEGNVIPLGLPEWSKTYISAMATYPPDIRSDGTPVYPKTHSPLETLWHAKKRAWGNKGDDCTAQGGAFYVQNISQYEPMSQSTKFYHNASVCIDDPSSCQNKDATEKNLYVDPEYTYLVTQFLYDGEGSDKFYEYLNNDECGTEHTSLDEKNGCETVEKINDSPSCGIKFKH